MGPSGCGKTTLLNVLARRAASSGAKTTGDCYIDGKTVDNATFGRLTSYVEQEDALIGSLTVRETLKFAADLSLPRCVSSYAVVTGGSANELAPLRSFNGRSAFSLFYKLLESRTRHLLWSARPFARESVVVRNGVSAWQVNS